MVALNYSVSCTEAQNVVAEIVAKDGRAMAVQADIADLRQQDSMIQQVLAEFGRIDILVNNAAIEKRVPAIDASPADWDRIFDVDLKGPFFLSQKVARIMRKQGGGAVLNIGSVHDQRAHRNNSLYTIAKGGIKLMTRNLALEWAEFNIRVNSLSPGAILTDINRTVLADDGYRKQTLAQIPLGRIGEASELVAAAVLLVSDEGSYITGTTLYVDGGLLL
jgi:glucose 1-dehydrogenase